MYKGNGYTATIEKVKGGYMLAVRNRRGNLLTRRSYRTHRRAYAQMWRWLEEE